MSKKMPNYIVFDLETGGFLKDNHEHGITEIAAIALDSESLEEIARYESNIIAPYKTFSGDLTTYTEGALSVTGIKMSQIENGRDAKEVAKEFINFANSVKCKGRFGQPILCGHNIDSFDIPFIGQYFELMKIDPSKNFSDFSIDTMWWSRLKFQESIINHKLATTAQACGVEIVDAHRAINDVEGNADVLRHFIRTLRGAGGEAVNLGQENRDKFRTTFQF